jgi:hypothetical protein
MRKKTPEPNISSSGLFKLVDQTTDYKELSGMNPDPRVTAEQHPAGVLYFKMTSKSLCPSVVDPDPYVFAPPGSGSISTDPDPDPSIIRQK